MDKEKLQKILRELLQDEIRHLVTDEGSDISQLVNTAVKAAMENLQNTLSGDPTLGEKTGTVSDSLVFSNIQGAQFLGGSKNMLVTPKGSILDLSRKNAPWVKCSKELADWAIEMGQYLNSGGKRIGKLLQEADDTLGGLELVMMGYGAYHEGR